VKEKKLVPSTVSQLVSDDGA